MRLDVVADNILERMAFWGGFVPKPIVQSSWGIKKGLLMAPATLLIATK